MRLHFKQIAIIGALFLGHFCFGQEALLPMPHQQFLDVNGKPLSGGKVYSFISGTSTPQATFTDSTGSTQQSNPIILDAGGFPPSGTSIWLGPQFYRILVQNSLGIQQYVVDNVSSYNLAFVTSFSFLEGAACSGSATFDIICGVAASHRLGFTANNGAMDLFVGQNTTDTLTNKILNSPVLHTPTIDAATFTGGGSLGGTFSGNPIFSGLVSFTSLNNIQFADQFATVQAAINALPAAGGTVYLQCGVAYAGPTSFPSGVKLESLCRTSLSPYSGRYSTRLTYSSSQTIGPAGSGFAIKGIDLDFSGGSGSLIIDGVQLSYFDMSVICGTGSPCVKWTSTTQNSAYNRVDYLNITSAGAIVMQWTGVGATTTLNDVHSLILNSQRATLGAITEFLGFTQNCDSNHFGSIHMFNVASKTNAGNGIVFNDSGTPAADTDADNIVIDLADFTSAISITGTAYLVNKSAGNMWREGFGQTSFTTAIDADATTRYMRLVLDGSSIALGNVNISTLPGKTLNNVVFPAVNGFGSVNLNAVDGSYQSKRNVAGCTTAASIGGVCASPITVTWPTSFPNTNYSAGCSPIAAVTNLPSTPYIVSKANGSMVINYFAISAAAASWGTLDCWAIHD